MILNNSKMGYYYWLHKINFYGVRNRPKPYNDIYKDFRHYSWCLDKKISVYDRISWHAMLYKYPSYKITTLYFTHETFFMGKYAEERDKDKI